MQGRHALLAHGIHLAERRLRLGDDVVVQVADQFIGRAPGRLVRFAHDHVQSDAKPDRAAFFCRARADVGNLFRDGGRRLAPRQVDVHLLGRQFMRGFRRAAEIQRWIRLLHGRVQGFCTLHLDMLALEIVAGRAALARQRGAPHLDEFIGDFIALGVVGKQAVRFQLALVAARDDVDQEAPVRQPVERGRHAHGQAGRGQAGTDGDEEFELLRHADQRRRHHPRIFAGAARRQQHAVVAERVGGHGHLAQIIGIDGTRALRRAQIAAVAVGRDKPEDIQ